jgi:hypothetical protein
MANGIGTLCQSISRRGPTVRLAKHFGVTPPPIRKALEIWRSMHPDTKSMPKKCRGAVGKKITLKEVKRHRSERSVIHLAAHFAKCEETIQKPFVSPSVFR